MGSTGLDGLDGFRAPFTRESHLFFQKHPMVVVVFFLGFCFFLWGVSLGFGVLGCIRLRLGGGRPDPLDNFAVCLVRAHWLAFALTSQLKTFVMKSMARFAIVGPSRAESLRQYFMFSSRATVMLRCRAW